MKRIDLEEKANEIGKMYYNKDTAERLELRDRIMEVVELALNMHAVGVTLPTIEKAEELWDEGAELIGTDIDSLDWVAGTMRMDRPNFIKACEKLKGN